MADQDKLIEGLEELEGYLSSKYEKVTDDIDTWYFRLHSVRDAINTIKDQAQSIENLKDIINILETI